MPVQTQLASIAAWNDEAHVSANRELYRAKFDAVLDILQPVLDVQRPDGGFYLWPRTPVDDLRFTRELFAQEHVAVVPGSYLSREIDGFSRAPGGYGWRWSRRWPSASRPPGAFAPISSVSERGFRRASGDARRNRILAVVAKFFQVLRLHMLGDVGLGFGPVAFALALPLFGWSLVHGGPHSALGSQISSPSSPTSVTLVSAASAATSASDARS